MFFNNLKDIRNRVLRRPQIVDHSKEHIVHTLRRSMEIVLVILLEKVSKNFEIFLSYVLERLSSPFFLEAATVIKT